jgi:streptogramin lyase
MVFRHDPLTGQCTAFLMLDGPGGVHGLQWRPDTLSSSGSGTLWVSRPGAMRIDHIDAASGHLLGSFQFPAPRSHGMFWDPTSNSLQIAETNGGRVFNFEPSSGELLGEWRIEGPEVHGFARGPDGRIWIGDASTNQVLVIDP